jgi:hypothetical protein
VFTTGVGTPVDRWSLHPRFVDAHRQGRHRIVAAPRAASQRVARPTPSGQLRRQVAGNSAPCPNRAIRCDHGKLPLTWTSGVEWAVEDSNL